MGKVKIPRLLMDYVNLPENTKTKRVGVKRQMGPRRDPFGWFNVGQATDETNRLTLVVGHDCGWLEMPTVQDINTIPEFDMWIGMVYGGCRIQLSRNRFYEIKDWVKECVSKYGVMIGNGRHALQHFSLQHPDIYMKLLVKASDCGVTHSFRVAYITPPYQRPQLG